MRILLVAYFYEAPAGGGIIVARLLREQLEERGHVVDVLCLAGCPETQPGQVWRIQLPRWARPFMNRVRQTLLFLNNPAFDRFMVARAYQLLPDSDAYDFVLSQDFLGIRVARILSDNAHAPCGATLHDTLPQQIEVGAPRPMVRRILRQLGRWRDRALVPELTRFAWLAAISRHVRDSAARWLQPSPPSLHVVYNPAPGAFGRVPPVRLETPLRFLIVGRLSPEKGVDLLVEAFRRIPGNHRLTVLGLAGSLAPRIQTLAAADPRIELRSAVPYSEMPAVYAEHQVVCCPAMWDEPFGLTVLEGRVTQRAVIGTNRGALPEILEGYPRACLFDGTAPSCEEQIQRLTRALAEAPRLVGTPLNMEAEAAFLRQFQLSTFADRYEALIVESVERRK